MNLRRLMRWPLVLALLAGLFPWTAGAWREVGQAAADAGDGQQEWEILIQKQHELLPKVMEIERRLEESGGDLLGGIRFEGARAVIQITEHGRERAMEMLAPFAESGDIDVETVRHSQRELEEVYERLNRELRALIMDLSGGTDSAAAPGIVPAPKIAAMWAIDHANNRIVLYSSDERIRARAAELVDPDMLAFRGSLRIVDQAGAAGRS